jgi:hypothetical protein
MRSQKQIEASRIDAPSLAALSRPSRIRSLEKQSIELHRAFNSQFGMPESRCDRQFNRSLATLLSLSAKIKKAPEPTKCP